MCRTFGCFPRQLYREDASELFRLFNIVKLGTPENGDDSAGFSDGGEFL